MKKILLTRGYEAVVSDMDYRRVSQLKWHAIAASDAGVYNVYAYNQHTFHLRTHGAYSVGT